MDRKLEIRKFFDSAKEIPFYGRDFEPFRLYGVHVKGLSSLVGLGDFLSAIKVDKWQLPSLATQEDIGLPHIVQQEFVKLAKLIGKPAKIRREDGDGHFYHIYTAYPDGKIEEVATQVA